MVHPQPNDSQAYVFSSMVGEGTKQQALGKSESQTAPEWGPLSAARLHENLKHALHVAYCMYVHVLLTPWH